MDHGDNYYRNYFKLSYNDDEHNDQSGRSFISRLIIIFKKGLQDGEDDNTNDDFDDNDDEEDDDDDDHLKFDYFDELSAASITAVES